MRIREKNLGYKDLVATLSGLFLFAASTVAMAGSLDCVADDNDPNCQEPPITITDSGSGGDVGQGTGTNTYGNSDGGNSGGVGMGGPAFGTALFPPPAVTKQLFVYSVNVDWLNDEYRRVSVSYTDDSEREIYTHQWVTYRCSGIACAPVVNTEECWIYPNGSSFCNWVSN